MENQLKVFEFVGKRSSKRKKYCIQAMIRFEVKFNELHDEICNNDTMQYIFCIEHK